MTSGVTSGTERLLGGRYRLHRPLARGGMGAVWLAYDERLRREVAVKEVVAPPGLDERSRDELHARTLREARAAARIVSPSAVTVYDVVEDEGRPWVVMELLRARSLADVLRDEGPLTAAEAATIGLRLLSALEAATAAGVLHRDVKPANVMLRGDGDAVLTDFGIATLEGDPSLTQTGAVIGSPAYLAPERARGEPATTASDLWSLGATLYAAVEGHPPFERGNAVATLTAAALEPVPPPRRAGALGPAIVALLDRDPAGRPGGERLRHLLERAAAAPAEEPTLEVTTPPRADLERTSALPVLDAPAPDGSAPAAPAAAAAPVAATTPGPAAPGARGPGSLPPPPSARPGQRGRRTSGWLVQLLAVAGALLVVLLAWLWLRDPGETPDAGSEPPGAGSGQGQEQQAEEEQEGQEQQGQGEGQDEGTEDPSATDDPGAEAPAPQPEEGEGESDEEQPQGDASAAEGSGPDAESEVPAGFQRYEDESGFSLTIPEGWRPTDRRSEGAYSTVRFREPGSATFLQVDTTTDPQGDPYENWVENEEGVSQRLADYELLGIERVDFRGWQAADWQFRYDDGDVDRRVLNRNVLVDDDTAHALLWSVPDDEWDEQRERFQQIAQSFEPAP